MTNKIMGLEELIHLCLKNNVRQVKYKGVELLFGDVELQQMDVKTDLPKFPDPDLNMPTDDDMLNWSTPLEELKDTKSQQS